MTDIHPETIRAQAFGIEAHKMFGQCITLTTAKTKENFFVLSVQSDMASGSAHVNVTLLPPDGLRKFLNAEAVPLRDALLIRVLSFMPDNGQRHFMQTPVGHKVHFEVNTQLRLPDAVRQKIAPIKAFTFAENINIPFDSHPPKSPEGYWENIIVGYGFQRHPETKEITPLVLLADAKQPSHMLRVFEPSYLLANKILPVTRTTRRTPREAWKYQS